MRVVLSPEKFRCIVQSCPRRCQHIDIVELNKSSCYPKVQESQMRVIVISHIDDNIRGFNVPMRNSLSMNMRNGLN